MLKIRRILERREILEFLENRGLTKQYRKAKQYLLAGNTSQVNFKKRHPKGSGIWYFRINKQYRAIGYFDDGDFMVTDIDDHQGSK